MCMIYFCTINLIDWLIETVGLSIYLKTHQNNFVYNCSKCWPISIGIAVHCLGPINHTVRWNLRIYLKRLLRDTNCSRRWCLKATIHIVPLQLVENSYFKLLQGSVATLFRRSWKILSCFVANLSKTPHISFYKNRSSIVEVMTKNCWCVFYAARCRSVNWWSLRVSRSP